MRFRILDNTGDQVMEFDMTVEEEAKLAVKQFDKFLNEGKMVIGIEQSGDKVMYANFDPTVVEYVVGNPLVGG